MAKLAIDSASLDVISLDWSTVSTGATEIANINTPNMDQSIAFEASERSLPLALIHFLASELSLSPISEIAR